VRDAMRLWGTALRAAAVLAEAGVDRPCVDLGCGLTIPEVEALAALIRVEVHRFVSMTLGSPLLVVYVERDVDGVRVHGQGSRAATDEDMAGGALLSTHRTMTSDEVRARMEDKTT